MLTLTPPEVDMGVQQCLLPSRGGKHRHICFDACLWSGVSRWVSNLHGADSFRCWGPARFPGAVLCCRLMGVELIATYLLIALMYLFIKETPSSNAPPMGTKT